MCILKNKNLFDVIKDCENINEILRSETLCFTGHRSQKLPWKFNEDDERCIIAKNKTRNEIENCIKNGYKYFISGMALGFDMISAEIVLELKKIYPHIKLICALPCKNQYKPWPLCQQQRYKKIVKQADIIRYISNEYTENCMLERNNYMLNNSSLVIALYNGKGGGTGYTIRKAREQGLDVIIINP